MKFRKLLLGAGFLATAIVGGAVADYTVTQGTGTTIFAFTCFTTKVCPAHVNVDSAGAEVGTTSAPFGVKGGGITIDTSVTRPADTTAYAVNDTWSDSTSAPTSGGYTLTAACRTSGGVAMLSDMIIFSTAVPATTLQGEIYLFESAGTNVNDNAAFALSDGDMVKIVGKVPFTLVAEPSNSWYHAERINLTYTCVGTANLRFLVKVKNVYTPVSAEVLTVRAKVIYVN